MKNVKIKNLNSKIATIFIMGLICLSSLGLNNTSNFISKNENPLDEILPRSSAFLENRTDYSKQMIVDPSFDLGSPWNSQEFDETNDTDAYLDLNQANYKVVGDQRNFYLNGTIDGADWTNFTNPDYPILPDTYIVDQDGLYVDHLWDEQVDQTRNTPSIQLKRNITMPVNMSDYTITSASVESIFNATVTVSPYGGGGIDVEGDPPVEFATGDYVRFYILISDLENNKVYEIAMNKSHDLGEDAGNIASYFDQLMQSVPEDVLIFYLTSVLETDYCNFTITVGIDIYCEDNDAAYDEDNWNELRIKTLNMTFEYKKNINQLTSCSWNQTGNQIDNNEYELGDDGYFIINNASLNFDYNISQVWPSSSLNTELRIFLNNYQISNTIKLTNFSTSIQNQIFDISPSLINASENITIKIQLYIADNFLLSNNITVTIDNVNLTTYFTVVERRNPIETNLETNGLSISAKWNESFSISLNYTNASNQVGISGSDFIIDWVDTYEIQEVGNGIYTLICNNTHKVSSTPYTLSVITNITNTWYETNSLTLEIMIIGRETKLDVFLEEVNKTSSPEIEIYYLNQLNITAHYYDNNSSEVILGATALLEGAGIDSSYYDYTEIGSAHEFILNTTKLGIGTHLISLFLNKENYTESYEQLRITVNTRQTSIDVFLNEDDLTLSPVIEVQFMSQLNITTHYYDNVLSEEILGATASLEGSGIDPSYYDYSVTGTAHEFILNTTKLGFGTHLLSLFLEKENYTTSDKQLRITVTPRETYLNVYANGVDSSDIDEFVIPIRRELNITLLEYDSESSELLHDLVVTLDGIDASHYSASNDGTSYQFIINTESLDLGIHFIAFSAEKTNYNPISKNFQVNVRQIQTNITTTNANQSYSIVTGEDFDLYVFIDDLDFGGRISGCEVSYSSSLGLGSGIINETESESGTYSISFDEVPRGIYTIYISVFKGPEYSFKQFEITLNVINPVTEDQGIPDFVFYIMGVLMVGLIASFIAYQQYFKFPKSVREIKSLSKAIKKGKAAEKELSVKAAGDLFVEEYISKTKGSLPSKNKALLKDRMGKGSSQKSMTKGDIKKDIKVEKVDLKEKKIAPKIPKEVKKPDTSRKPSKLEESLELPEVEQPKKVESTQKIEKIKPDQFVKPHNIEESDLKQISKDQKPKKIRYLRKPKIKELPKKTPKKPKKD
jgi:hypothetical protein